MRSRRERPVSYTHLDVYKRQVLFEFLTGRVPFEGDTTATVLLKHLTASVPAARPLNPKLPEGIEEVLNIVLAKERCV